MASPYLNLATDGTDLGADMAAITALTTVAQTGDRRGVTETRYGGTNQWFSYNSIQRAQYPRTLITTDLPSWASLFALPQHSVSGDTALRALLTGTTLTTGGHVVIVDHAPTYTGDYFGNWPVRSAGDTVPGGTNCVFFFSKAIWDSMVANAGTATVCPEKLRIAETDLASLVRFRSLSGLGQFAVYATVNGLAVPTNGFRFVGFDFGVDASLGAVSHLVQAGSGDGAIQNKASQCASNIGFDRCYFNGHAGSEIRHTLELHCKYGYAVDSLWGENNFVINYSDSQPLTMYNGPGPFRVVNNQLTGGVENVIIGGAASPCGAPSDIEFRYNLMTRPTSWYGSGKQVKCGFEVKKAKYLLVEGNIIENTWPAGQIGAGFLIKSESYGDGPVTGYSSDILLRHNLVRNVAHGLTFASPNYTGDAGTIARAISYNNLYRVGGGLFDASQNPFIGAYLSIDCGSIHDTFIAEGTVNAIAQPTNPVGFVILDTIFGPTTYGLKSTAAEGSATIALMSGATINKVIFTGRSSGSYPAGNYFPADVPAIQFTNVAAKDYSLLSTSQTGGGTVTPVATALRIVRQPSGGESGSVLTTQPQVEILDQFGNRFNATATVTATSDSGSVSDTGNAVAAVAGLATFTTLTGTAGATASTPYTFSSPGLTSVTSSSVSITVPVASPVATALRVVTQPAGAVSGVALTQQPVVEVIDQYGTRITSAAAITATAIGEGVSVVAGSPVNAVAGLATFTTLTLTTLLDGRTATLRFIASGLTSVDSTAFPCALFPVVIPPPIPDTDPAAEPPASPPSDPVPAQLVFTREPGPVGKLYSRKKWPQQPVVEARDANGVLMTSYHGPLTIYTTSSTITLRGTATVNAIGGVGRWTNLSAVGSGPLDLNVTDGPEPDQ